MINQKTSGKLIFVGLKELLEQVDGELKQCLNYKNDIVDLTPLLSELNNISSDSSILRLAIAGQSGVGKTSLIKALTGEDLFIDADVSTDSIYEIKYKDTIVIIDMPGTLSGLSEHDVTARQAILESDLMLFVLTNELFNASNYESFELAMSEFHKDTQTLLVINQFDRVNLRNRTSTDAIFLIKEDLAERIAPRDLDCFKPVFISARDVLDANIEEDLAYRDQLMEDSRITTLIEAIDEFCVERGYTGRLAKLLQLRLDFVMRATTLTTGNETEQSVIYEFLKRKIEIYMTQQQSLELEKRNLLIIMRRDIIKLADSILTLIDNKANADEINAGWNDADSQTTCIIEETAEQLEVIMVKALTNLNKDLVNLDESPIAIAIDGFLNYDIAENEGINKVQDHKLPIGIKVAKSMNLTDSLKTGGEFLAKNADDLAANVVKAVSKFKKFKPYGKIKLGSKAGKVLGKGGKALGPLALGVEIYFNYQEEKKLEEAEKERLRFKAEVRKTLADASLKYRDQLNLSFNEFSYQYFGKQLSEITEKRQLAIQLSNHNKDIQSELLLIENKLRDGLRLIANPSEG
jgi:GTPase SAR1 family protein